MTLATAMEQERQARELYGAAGKEGKSVTDLDGMIAVVRFIGVGMGLSNAKTAPKELL